MTTEWLRLYSWRFHGASVSNKALFQKVPLPTDPMPWKRSALTAVEEDIGTLRLFAFVTDMD